MRGGNFDSDYIYHPLPGDLVRLQSVYSRVKTADEGGNGKPVQWIRSLLGGAQARVVYEPFGGTGSTILAAPPGVVVRSIEIDPEKVDQIVRRFQQFTGKQATLEATGVSFDRVERERGAQ